LSTFHDLRLKKLTRNIQDEVVVSSRAPRCTRRPTSRCTRLSYPRMRHQRTGESKMCAKILTLHLRVSTPQTSRAAMRVYLDREAGGAAPHIPHCRQEVGVARSAGTRRRMVHRDPSPSSKKPSDFPEFTIELDYAGFEMHSSSPAISRGSWWLVSGWFISTPPSAHNESLGEPCVLRQCPFRPLSKNSKQLICNVSESPGEPSRCTVSPQRTVPARSV
jgi:hypothetical protein